MVVYLLCVQFLSLFSYLTSRQISYRVYLFLYCIAPLLFHVTSFGDYHRILEEISLNSQSDDLKYVLAPLLVNFHYSSQDLILVRTI